MAKHFATTDVPEGQDHPHHIPRHGRTIEAPGTPATEAQEDLGFVATGSPDDTAAFMEALDASRTRQHTQATYTKDREARDRVQRIQADVADPAGPGVRIPVAPSAPAPSPYIEPVIAPGERPCERVSADTTGVFMAAWEESAHDWVPRRRPVDAPAHFARPEGLEPEPVAAEVISVTAVDDDGETVVGDRDPASSKTFNPDITAPISGGTAGDGIVEVQDLDKATVTVEGEKPETPAAMEATPTLAEEIADAQGAAPALNGQASGEVEPTGIFEGGVRETDVAQTVDEEDGLASEAAVGRSAAMMSLLVIVSRVTGFLRTWGQGAAIGGAMLASCYTVANNLPNQLYELVMGGMLVTAFLPVYLAVKKEGGRERANQYTSNLVSIVLLIMGAVAVLGIVFASQVVYTQSFNATSEFDHGLATYFFRFFAVEVVLYGLSSVFSGVLNAERDYFWSTAAPIFNNIICTASFLGYGLLVGTNEALAVLILAIGNPLGVAIQVIMQIPSLKRLGVRLSLHIDWHDPALKDTLAIGIPSIVVMVVSFATVSVQTSCVLSATASGAAVAYYSRLWYTLPYAILAIPVTTAMFTELSQAYAQDDMDAFGRGVSSGVQRILFFLVPFAMFLVVFAPELSSLLNAGAFTADELAMISGYLQALALSLPFYGVCTYLQKVCSSLRKMRLFATANVIAGVFQIVFCLVLTPVWGYVIPGLSSLFFFVVMDVVTFVQLRHELGPIGFKAMVGCGVRSALLGLAGSVVGGLILWILTGPVGFQGSGLLHGLVLCVAGGIPAVVVTFGGAMALHLPEAGFLRSMVGRFASKAA